MSLTRLARSLRRRQTDAERKLWTLLRDKRLAGFKFRRQQPLGPYIVDFLCRERGLVVELDGGQHAGSQRDVARTKFLEGYGFSVVRFWDNELLKNSEAVVEMIARKLEGLGPHPRPLPRGEGKTRTHG